MQTLFAAEGQIRLAKIVPDLSQNLGTQRPAHRGQHPARTTATIPARRTKSLLRMENLIVFAITD